MKVVILAGGMQSTLSPFGEGIPKPMAEIGGKPLLWHIMKHFSQYGMNEFIICGGYRVDVIKDYFLDFYVYESDITVDLETNTIKIHQKKTEDWKVTVVDTGLNASPGQRLLAIGNYIEADPESSVLVTYGDCLSDINIEEMIKAHKDNDKLVTLAMAKPQGRKQMLTIDETGLLDYQKNNTDVKESAWVNGDCFVLDKRVLSYLEEKADLETQVFQALSKIGQVAAFKHNGYWVTVETMRDLVEAERLWDEGQAPWIRK